MERTGTIIAMVYSYLWCWHIWTWVRSKWLTHNRELSMKNLGCAHQSSSLYPCGILGLMDDCSWGCFWLILVIAARMLCFITFTPSYWLPGILNLANCLSCCLPLSPSFQSPSLGVFEGYHESNWTWAKWPRILQKIILWADTDDSYQAMVSLLWLYWLWMVVFPFTAYLFSARISPGDSCL